MKPQDAVACRGVQPSLSPRFTSAPCWTRNSTMSRLSSMHACKQAKQSHSSAAVRTHTRHNFNNTRGMRHPQPPRPRGASKKEMDAKQTQRNNNSRRTGGAVLGRPVPPVPRASKRGRGRGGPRGLYSRKPTSTHQLNRAVGKAAPKLTAPAAAWQQPLS